MTAMASETYEIYLKGESIKRERNCMSTVLLYIMYHIMSKNISQGHNDKNCWLWKTILSGNLKDTDKSFKTTKKNVVRCTVLAYKLDVY